MKIYWKIGAFADDGSHLDRLVCCDTAILPPADRHFLEFVAETRYRNNVAFVNYRQRFCEVDSIEPSDAFQISTVSEYFEDAVGNPLDWSKHISNLTGQPGRWIRIENGSTPADHDLQVRVHNGDSIAGWPPPLVTQEEFDLFKVCARDCHLLRGSKFLTTQSAFTMSGVGDSHHKIATLPHEHITHFVAILRRLQLENDPANFVKAVKLFGSVFRGTAIGNWAGAARKRVDLELRSPVEIGLWHGKPSSFTMQELINGVIYVKFIHQASAERIDVYKKLLTEVGDQDLLAWMFFSAVQDIALEYCNTILYLERAMDWAARYHNLTPPSIELIDAVDSHSLAEEMLSKQERERFEYHVFKLGQEQSDGSSTAEVDASIRFARELLRAKLVAA